MTDRDALARTIVRKLRKDYPTVDIDAGSVIRAIDALRAEGWSIVKLRPANALDRSARLYVIKEGEL